MWFSAKLLFESEVDDKLDNAPLQEESIRLIQAENEETAKRKAEIIGNQSQHGYLNDRGDRVQWRFVRLIEVQDLCESELYDGVEVYSQMSWKTSGKLEHH